MKGKTRDCYYENLVCVYPMCSIKYNVKNQRSKEEINEGVRNVHMCTTFIFELVMILRYCYCCCFDFLL
ncbi:hypothetical protein BDA99DRAFT_503252 [Phascolomyces articulosus]|uniref:Uncharacterized protein n=1 Tax=Phascolomyces articulosus TaxID=60185 RepID=A0AAD5K4H6_9FUNG|nr:hypothetical protein BDA99DRAFT_503252 [Phascolomyces articulosus]